MGIDLQLLVILILIQGESVKGGGRVPIRNRSPTTDSKDVKKEREHINIHIYLKMYSS